MSGCCVAVGRFDGVHLGHQHLLAHARAVAQKLGLKLVAYTFPPRGPSLLTLPAKERLLRALVDEVVVADWPGIQGLSAEEFVRTELVERLGARAVVVGPNHRFGRGREGDVALLQQLGCALGFQVQVVATLEHNGQTVSAGWIRQLVQEGQVREARALLGRPPWLAGQPVRGLGLARQLGFPTVNLELFPELLRPREGVYAAWALWPHHAEGALFYLGQRPTMGLAASAEVHLLTPPAGEVHGPVEVYLLAFLRPDERFSSVQALVRAIEGDKRRAWPVLKAAQAQGLPPSLLS